MMIKLIDELRNDSPSKKIWIVWYDGEGELFSANDESELETFVKEYLDVDLDECGYKELGTLI